MSWGKGYEMMEFLKNQMMFKIQSEKMKMDQEKQDWKLHMQQL